MRRWAWTLGVFVLTLLFVSCKGGSNSVQAKLSIESASTECIEEQTQPEIQEESPTTSDRLYELLCQMVKDDPRYMVGFVRYFDKGIDQMLKEATAEEQNTIEKYISQLWEIQKIRGDFVQCEGFPDELGKVVAAFDALLMQLWRR